MASKYSPHTDTTVATWSNAIWQTLAAYDVDPEPLFHQAGLESNGVADLNQRYPVQQMTQLWELSVAKTKDRCFGLEVAKRINTTSLFLLGLMAMSSKDTQQARDVLRRYFQLFSDSLSMEINTENNWSLTLGTKPGHEAIHPTCFEATIASVIHFARQYMQEGISPKTVNFRHAGPEDPSTYETFFGCAVKFNSDEYSIVATKEKAVKVLSTANPALFSANEEILDRYARAYRQQCFSHQIKDAITQHTPSFPKQSELARELGISESKLQKKLYAEGTRYQDIVDEVRQNLAQLWLTERHKSISEIAWELGFSEVSSFTRAFKRWNGIAPSAYLRDNPSA